jgi:hypothetical protein
MYSYSEFDDGFVRERVRQFRGPGGAAHRRLA